VLFAKISNVIDKQQPHNLEFVCQCHQTSIHDNVLSTQKCVIH